MSSDIVQVNTCEVCGNTSLVTVLDLGYHPMCDDLIRNGSSEVCREYPIEILLCRGCLTAHQRFQIPKRELFPLTYHYRARFTADVLNGMADLANQCEDRYGDLGGKKVLDIGCNDGSLLDCFKRKGAITLGIEPTGAEEEAKQKGHQTYNTFFDLDIAGRILATYGKFDFITFTNVFAHIENLAEVIASLKLLIDTNTVIVIENHYLGAVLDGNQFDTFYHEHPRTYSYTSFVHIAKSLGVTILSVEFPKRYGGNIRVFMGNQGCELHVPGMQDLVKKEESIPERFSLLEHHVEQWKQNKSKIIDQLVRSYGKLPAKAFPGRAAILVKILGLTEDSISAVYEKPGSLKIGYYVPGTRIPILSDDILFQSQNSNKPVLNLAWHIAGEIRRYMLDKGYQGEVVDIIDKNDFGGS